MQALGLPPYQKRDSDTGFFLSPFYWTPPVATSSYFKTSGFAEAVMQMNFWISYDVVHLKIFSSSWHFCVCFWRAQTFRCISTASFTFKIQDFCSQKWQRRIWLTIKSANFLVRKAHRNNHRITSMFCCKLCNWNAFWNMNNVFTVTSQITYNHI